MTATRATRSRGWRSVSSGSGRPEPPSCDRAPPLGRRVAYDRLVPDLPNPLGDAPDEFDPSPGWARLRDYLSLVRFSHTVFALPFATLGAVLAWRSTPFEWPHLVGFLVCMVAARTAAMAFNRLVDQEIDAKNERTATRELPSGKLTPGQVKRLIAVSIAAFVLGTTCFLPNWWPLAAGPLVLAVLLGYSLAKRWTPLCHYWLGFALGLSPVCAYVAITAELAAAPIWLGVAILCWVGGFDILYACQDEAFDREAGLRSIPARFGRRRSFTIARLSHAATIVSLLAFGLSAGFGPIFAIGLALITLALAYEHWIVGPDDLRRVGVAFFQMNALVSFGVLAFGVADVIW